MARTRKPSGRRVARSISSYDRKAGKRRPRRCVLIVCEGKRTEPLYFRSLVKELRLATVDVSVTVEGGKGGDPRLVVERARSKRNEARSSERPFDNVWCVFDAENPNSNLHFNSAVTDARQEEFDLAISNPAFEFWYLLHFQDTDRPFENASVCIEVLKKEGIPDYDKGCCVLPILYEHTDTAIQRATRILENSPDQDTEFPNPSTRVFRLVEILKDMSTFR